MREADRRTIAGGTAQQELMRRAAQALVNVMERECAPLFAQRVVILCGKGNNGGDGLVAAQLLEGRVAALQVVRADETVPKLDRDATVVVDALFGTGFQGEVTGSYAELIRAVNHDFIRAKIIAVDIPSAMQVRADITVTFAAPKAEMLMSANAHLAGRIVVEDIGIPEAFLASQTALSEGRDFAFLFRPRKRDAHKGNFGHVLVVGGAAGKTGAAAMAGMAALRAGAGLVTVACADPQAARLIPELMTAPLDLASVEQAMQRATVLAIGPGLGMQREFVEHIMHTAAVPTVIDADGLNSIAGSDFRGRGAQTIVTPHPLELARLMGVPKQDYEPAEKLERARAFARERNVCLVWKGHRTLIAVPDGIVWINPTGSPALAKGGTGDILTGLIAGLVASSLVQFPGDVVTAVRAAVWLHGRCGELGAQAFTENCLLASELLQYLPAAIRECATAT
jgi:hydroxyethylthiazole kinase-like uncharacterized protein yjeF